MPKQNLIILETNIDDMNPQVYDYLIEKGLRLGAKDIWLENIQMKKNRPAVKLSILTVPQAEKKFTDFLFKETTSLGVRVYAVKRSAAPRNIKKVSTAYGPVHFKYTAFNRKKPEYADLKKIALEKNIPLIDLL